MHSKKRFLAVLQLSGMEAPVMKVLGINAYHRDVSVVRDGELVAAVEEERFRRVKH